MSGSHGCDPKSENFSQYFGFSFQKQEKWQALDTAVGVSAKHQAEQNKTERMETLY